jgi:hypothetical protein
LKQEGKIEMKLFDKFKIQKPENQSEHYELFVEGDWGNGDIVSKKTSIEKDIFENDDYLLYFISYISTWCGKRYDPKGKFNETDEWSKLFEDAEEFGFLPIGGYEQDIHTITKVKLEFVSGTSRYPVSIPSFGCLFSSYDERDRKVLEAKNAFE